jgi:polysaccharide biosynthesis/export protein
MGNIVDQLVIQLSSLVSLLTPEPRIIVEEPYMTRTQFYRTLFTTLSLCATQLICSQSIYAQARLTAPAGSSSGGSTAKSTGQNSQDKASAGKASTTGKSTELVPDPKDEKSDKKDNDIEVIEVPVSTIQNNLYGPMTGTNDRCNYSICNLPTQPQVAPGRCQPHTVAIDCADNCRGGQSWKNLHPYPFQPLAHGEYRGPTRLPSTLDVRIRIGDTISFTFIDSPTQLTDSYRLMVGDEVAIDSNTDDKVRKGDITLGKGLTVLPHGMIHVPLIGEVRAEGLTIPQLRNNLEKQYKFYIKDPSIDVTPVRWNSLKTAILNSVDARAGTGGQFFNDTVHPDGTIRLPKIGQVCVLGLTLDEIKREINLRYNQVVPGLEIEPRIATEAQHFVYVTGEVNQPNRYALLGPTTVSQALALAGGPKVGGNLREIVIFRRAEDWRLIATRIDLRGAHLGKSPSPADEIWLRDNDLIIVPQTPIKLFNNFVRQVFTEGVYGVVPFGGFSITQFQGGSVSSN